MTSLNDNVRVENVQPMCVEATHTMPYSTYCIECLLYDFEEEICLLVWSQVRISL